MSDPLFEKGYSAKGGSLYGGAAREAALKSQLPRGREDVKRRVSAFLANSASRKTLEFTHCPRNCCAEAAICHGGFKTLFAPSRINLHSPASK